MQPGGPGRPQLPPPQAMPGAGVYAYQPQQGQQPMPAQPVLQAPPLLQAPSAYQQQQPPPAALYYQPLVAYGHGVPAQPMVPAAPMLPPPMYAPAPAPHYAYPPAQPQPPYQQLHYVPPPVAAPAPLPSLHYGQMGGGVQQQVQNVMASFASQVAEQQTQQQWQPQPVQPQPSSSAPGAQYLYQYQPASSGPAQSPPAATGAPALAGLDPAAREKVQSVLAKFNARLGEGGGGGPVKSMIDQRERDRVAKARERNLEYMRK